MEKERGGKAVWANSLADVSCVIIRKEGNTNEVREAGSFVLAFLHSLRDVFGAMCLPSRGEMPKKAALLEKRNVVPAGSGVSEQADPLHHHLLKDRERGHLPKFAKSGVSAEGGFRPREGFIRLFQQVGLGGVLHVAAHLARKNIGWAEEAYPLGGPHLGKGAGLMELLLHVHGNLAGDGKLRRSPTDRQDEAVLSEELVSRDEMFTCSRNGGDCCASRRPRIPEGRRKGGGRRHGVQIRKVDIRQVGRKGETSGDEL